jgi:hypothetical protein
MNPFIPVLPPEQAACSPDALPHLPAECAPTVPRATSSEITHVWRLPGKAHGLRGPLCCIDRVRARRAARRLIENATAATGLGASLLWWQVAARADLREDLLHGAVPKVRSCGRYSIGRSRVNVASAPGARVPLPVRSLLGGTSGSNLAAGCKREKSPCAVPCRP